MRKLLLAALMLLPVKSLADTVTPNYGFIVPSNGTLNWAAKVDDWAIKLDTGAAGLFHSNTFGQSGSSNTFIGPVYISSTTTITAPVTNTSSETITGAGGLSVTYGASASSIAIAGTQLVCNAPGYGSKCGIGTATPNANLSVEFNGTAGALNTATNAGVDLFEAHGNHLLLGSDANNSYNYYLQTDAGQALSLLPVSGNVGVGTMTPGHSLDVWGATGINSRYGVSAGSATIGTTDLVTDPVNHRVGIGTASPGVSLDVKGTQEGIRTEYAGHSVGFGLSGLNTLYSLKPYIDGVQQSIGFASNSGVSIGYGSNDPPASGAIISGGVGIGTTSPGSVLDVNGDATVHGPFTVAGSSLTVGGALAMPSNTALSLNGSGGNDSVSDDTPNQDGVKITVAGVAAFKVHSQGAMLTACYSAVNLRTSAPTAWGFSAGTNFLIVPNCNDFDLYTATGTGTTGQWRNERTGNGP